MEASRRLQQPFGIIDLSLAPTPAIGDSVADILEEMGLESCGACGTTAALALLNDAVKKGGLMASSRVGGLSGAFIPVSEDKGMLEAVGRGSLTLEKLEAMTCVCSVGLDMIALPGDTAAETIAGIIADEAAIGMINNKTTAVRVIPVPGKKSGGPRGIRRPFGTLSDYPGQSVYLRRVYCPRRSYSGTIAQLNELGGLNYLWKVGVCSAYQIYRSLYYRLGGGVSSDPGRENIGVACRCR